MEAGAFPRNMCADKKAQAVGDILTILIQENNGATRQNNTTTSKKASLNAAIASILYSPAAIRIADKERRSPGDQLYFGR